MRRSRSRDALSPSRYLRSTSLWGWRLLGLGVVLGGVGEEEEEGEAEEAGAELRRVWVGRERRRFFCVRSGAGCGDVVGGDAEAGSRPAGDAGLDDVWTVCVVVVSMVGASVACW